jgi:hypothetical protein
MHTSIAPSGFGCNLFLGPVFKKIAPPGGQQPPSVIFWLMRRQEIFILGVLLIR